MDGTKKVIEDQDGEGKSEREGGREGGTRERRGREMSVECHVRRRIYLAMDG